MIVSSDLNEAAVASRLKSTRPASWAIAMGGTRRAYIAQGGVLASNQDLAAYMCWADEAQQRTLDRLFDLGVAALIAVIRIPTDRGAAYGALAAQAVKGLVDNPRRKAWHADRRLRVSAAGNLSLLAAAAQQPDLEARLGELHRATCYQSGPQLVYLLRGTWVDSSTEEANVGYRLGLQLGRALTRDELVRAYYNMDLPPLAVYVGSGRPQIGALRPPFLGGNEHCYWSQTPLMLLGDADWRRILDDHRVARRTHSNRSYSADDASRAQLNATFEKRRIIGVGKQHALGFWTPE